ncbi:MAG: glutathione peroxidase [Flavobacteriales bacterium]|nr:glutathione peroxidase [Flavobacteriales bacterium]
MKYLLVFLIIFLIGCMNSYNDGDNLSFYDIRVKTIDGDYFDLSTFRGKKLLVVNVASKCGLTSQYKQLEELYKEYKNQNFEVLAFPSSDFANQEYSDSQKILSFCKKNYGVTFPIFEKVSVRGKSKHFIYQWLTEKNKNGKKNVSVLWNFQKFTIDENGQWVDYFSPTTSPKSKKIVKWINS